MFVTEVKVFQGALGTTVQVFDESQLIAAYVVKGTIAAPTKEEPKPIPPAPSKSLWEQLIAAVKASSMTDAMKVACVAQAALESARGTSDVARFCTNFWGMKMRPDLEKIAVGQKVTVTSEDEGFAIFANFPSVAVSIQGWQIFLSRPFYAGWEEHKNDAEAFLQHIGAAWCPVAEYADKVIALLPEARKLLGIAEQPAPKPVPSGMPAIDVTEYDSPNCSTRGATISGLVVHNTDSSFDSAVSWLCNPAAQASAHLIIGRDGKVACIVDLSKKAWHAGNARVNATTIGIEVEADEKHQGMTQIQEQVLIRWIRWSMKKYAFGADKVITHRTIVETDCPKWIFPTEQYFAEWKKKNL